MEIKKLKSMISINNYSKTVKIYDKVNYNHLANLLNYKFREFNNLEKYILVNENETFIKKIEVHPKYLFKYTNDILDYLNNINS